MSRSIKVDQIADAFSAVPGVIILIDGENPPSMNYDPAAGTTQVSPWPDTPPGGASDPNYHNFVVSVSGKYLVQLRLTHYSSSAATTCRYKLVIDENTGDEFTIGDDTTWECRSAGGSDYTIPTFSAEVDFTAGSHTLKIYGLEINGTDWRIVGAVPSFAPQVSMHLVSGSGAGGILTESIELQADFDPATTDTWYDIDNGGGDKLEITVDVFEGEHVLIVGSGQTYRGSAAACNGINVDVDGIPISSNEYGIAGDCNDNTLSNSCFSVLSPSLDAGSRTFTLRFKTQNATGSVRAGYLFQVLRFRGGLVPWERDGYAVLDTPRAINIIGGAMSVADDGTGKLNIELPEAVTVEGTSIEILLHEAATNQTLDSASWADLGAGGDEVAGSFSVDEAGLYSLELSVTALRTENWSSTRFRLVFDAGTGNEQVIGNDDRSSDLMAVYRGNGIYYSTVTLSSGSHTVKVQYKRIGGTANAIYETPYSVIRLMGTLLSGSGAGGVLTDLQTNNTDVVCGTSSPVVINTHSIEAANEAILLDFSFPIFISSVTTYDIYYRVDGGSWVPFCREGDSTGYVNGVAGQTSITLNQGSHIIEIGVQGVAASVTVQGATAWPARSTVWQFRGGLVPIRRDGETIVDKPVALDFVGAGVYEVTNSGGTARIELNQAITAPGVRVSISDEITAEEDIGTTYERILPDPNGTPTYLTFEIPAAGLYSITALFQPAGVSSAESWTAKLVIDEGTSDEQTLGDNTKWTARCTASSITQAYIATLIEQATLSAGSHTATLYLKELGTGGTIRMFATDPGSPYRYKTPEIVFTLVTGSGAGGNIIASAAKTADQVVAFGSTVKLTELDLTFETSEQEDITLHYLICGTTNSGTITSTLPLYRVDGGSWLPLANASSSWDRSVTGSFVHRFSAGSHTVEFGVYVNIVNLTVFGGDTTFFGYYPTSRTWAVQDRGGLVPIRADGETVIDKPAAINYIGPNVQVTNTGGTANIQFNGVTGTIRNEPFFSKSPFDRASPAAESGNFTTGVKFVVTKPGAKIPGVYFYTGRTGSHTMRISLWDASGADVRLKQADILCSGPGFYEGLFATPYEVSDSEIASSEFVASSYEVTGTEYTTIVGTLDAGYYHFRDYVCEDWARLYGTGDVEPTTNSTARVYPVDPIIDVPGDPAGFVQPENVPILEYNSASVVNVKSGPGASSELRVLLNDGSRYTATSPLTIDLTASGLGGLDTGSEANSTWYFAYLVPGTATGTLSVVASVTDPDSGGPTGYAVWRYIGSIWNNSSGNIEKFRQFGNQFLKELSTIVAEAPSTGASEAAPGTLLADLVANGHVPVTADLISVTSWVGHSTDQWVLELRDNSTGTMLVEHNQCYDGGANTRSEVPLPTSVKKFYRRIYRVAGSSSNADYYAIYCLGWRDSFLTTGTEARAQAPYTPDTKSPLGTWATTSTVGFGARPGQSSTTRLTLQDGVQRYMTTGTWDVANGVADWGYDEADSYGSDRWQYFYAVPKSGDDTQLVVRASDNPPSTGPTGYSNWKLVWVTYMGTVGSLAHVFQQSNMFRYQIETEPAAIAALTKTTFINPGVEYNIADKVPASAQGAAIHAKVVCGSTGAAAVFMDVFIEGYTDTTTTGNTLSNNPAPYTRMDTNDEQWDRSETDEHCFPLVSAAPKIGLRIYNQASAALGGFNIYVRGWVDGWVDS